MKNVCIICGAEFESARTAKLCSDACKAERKKHYVKKSAVETPAPEVVEAIVQEVVKEEPKSKEKTKTEPKPVKQSNPDNKWILTVKDKASKTFKNIIFPTPDVKVAHAFIDNMRKEKVLSFVSLCDTDRIEAYLETGTISKTFKGNVNACLARKVPVEPLTMFKEMLEEAKKATGVEETITVELLPAEATDSVVA